MASGGIIVKTLKKRRQFLAVARGRSQARRDLVVQALRARSVVSQGSAAEIGVGFTASKKVGGAVVRNRAKRRLRALAREILPKQGLAGCDYVLIARAATASQDFAVLRASAIGAVQSVNRQLR